MGFRVLPSGTPGRPRERVPQLATGGSLEPCSDQVQGAGVPSCPRKAEAALLDSVWLSGNTIWIRPRKGVGRRQDAAPPPLHPPLSSTGSSLGGRWQMGWPGSQGSRTVPLPVTSAGLSPRWFSSSTSLCPPHRPGLLSASMPPRLFPGSGSTPVPLNLLDGGEWVLGGAGGRTGKRRDGVVVEGGPLHWSRGGNTAW